MKKFVILFALLSNMAGYSLSQINAQGAISLQDQTSGKINIRTAGQLSHKQNNDKDSQLMVGFSSMDLNPEIGIPLAGYGSPIRRLKPVDRKNRYENCFFFKPSEGFHTPIRVKVMVLKGGEEKIVFISIDVVGIENQFIEDLADKLSRYRIKEEDLIVTATHTHSGPGTLSRRLPLELVAVDLFINKNYRSILRKVADCIILALENAEPALLYSSSFITTGLQMNKFRKADQDWYDPVVNLLFAKSVIDGYWLGGIVNFGVHGGGMPIDTMLFSSDFPGQVEMQMENKIYNLNDRQEEAVVLFMNGAEGDVATPQRGVSYIEKLGEEFIDQADSGIEKLTPVKKGFKAVNVRIWLGIPALPLKYSSGDESLLKKSPFLFRLCLYPFMPQYSYINLIEIGDITIMTWPGEPSTELGYQLQAVAKRNGHMSPWVFGLTNDYVGYFTSKEEFGQGFYDASSSLYNFRGAQRILRRYDKLLRE